MRVPQPPTWLLFALSAAVITGWLHHGARGDELTPNERVSHAFECVFHLVQCDEGPGDPDDL